MNPDIQPNINTETSSTTKAMTDHGGQGAGSLVPTIESPNRQSRYMTSSTATATAKQSNQLVMGNIMTIENLLNPSTTQSNPLPTPESTESPPNGRIRLKDAVGRPDEDIQYLPLATTETTPPTPQRELEALVTETEGGIHFSLVHSQVGASAPQFGLGDAAIRTPAGIPPPPQGPTSNSATYTYVIQSRDTRPAPKQAPRGCWSHLRPFPSTGTKIGDRDNKAWLPYLEALGLTPNEFPAIQVNGMKPQTGNAGGEKTSPSWNFLIYALIAVSPLGKLESREIYHLCLAWCPSLDSKNQSCRASLTKKDEFRLEDDFHRLSWIGEPPKVKKKDKEDKVEAERPTANQLTANEPTAKEQPGTAPAKKPLARNSRSKKESTAKESAPQQPSPQSSGSSRSSTSSPAQISQIPPKRTTTAQKRKRSQSRASDDTVQDKSGPGPQTEAPRKRSRTAPQPEVDNKDEEPQLNGGLGPQAEAQMQTAEDETAPRTAYSTKKNGKIVTYRKMRISQWKEAWSKQAALKAAYGFKALNTPLAHVQDHDGNETETEFLSPVSPAAAPAPKRAGPFIEPPRLPNSFATGSRNPKAELEVMFSTAKYRAMMEVSATNSGRPSPSTYYGAEEWARLWGLERRRIKFDRSHRESRLVLGLRS
jgi:hypothetical protein